MNSEEIKERLEGLFDKFDDLSGQMQGYAKDASNPANEEYYSGKSEAYDYASSEIENLINDIENA